MTDDDARGSVDTVWITSTGGPLILIPESACDQWGGALDDYSDRTGAYGRACAVNDCVGLIDVGPAKALVLGDHPADTTFVPERGSLLRVIASDDDLDPTRTVTALLADVNLAPARYVVQAAYVEIPDEADRILIRLAANNAASR